MSKKKTHQEADSEPETESDAEDDHENGQEYKDLELDARLDEVGPPVPVSSANPWDPGPGRATVS